MFENSRKDIALSIVVPVYNEHDSIEPFLRKVISVCAELGDSYEIVFVNDGSTDGTQQVLAESCERHSQISVIKLSRNFGKEAALSAGLEFSVGAAVVPMDVDLQDPPELILELYRKFEEGFDSVLAVRSTRSGDRLPKRFFAKSFYWLFTRLSETKVVENVGDFRLMSRRHLQVVNSMPEKTRYMKGILSWPGFKSARIYYDRPERKRGSSKWRFSKLVRLAMDGIFSFSAFPLKVWTYIGMVLAIFSILFMLFTVIKTLTLGVDIPGYASLISVILLIGGVNLIGIGMLGEYVSRIFVEVKGRPLYVIDSVTHSLRSSEPIDLDATQSVDDTDSSR